MNGLYRFALILGVVALLFYFINQRSEPVKNQGSVEVDVVDVNVPEIRTPESPALGYEARNDMPYEIPVGSPVEAVSGADVARVSWDGIQENQLNAGLSKQYQELTADDLLPYNDMAHWADIYPSGTGQLQNKNFLHAAHHVGINTVGQTLKNANQQLRSEPANPQVQVSPWLQSSYSPDLLRAPLEIGSSCA
jgi:hypothetical protein